MNNLHDLVRTLPTALEKTVGFFPRLIQRHSKGSKNHCFLSILIFAMNRTPSHPRKEKSSTIQNTHLTFPLSFKQNIKTTAGFSNHLCENPKTCFLQLHITNSHSCTASIPTHIHTHKNIHTKNNRRQHCAKRF